ncbi:MAG: arylesterase, partial [Gemmatimonadetes bacterium]|nr:arylesterase [Gemmatimonadota bacterium]
HMSRRVWSLLAVSALACAPEAPAGGSVDEGSPPAARTQAASEENASGAGGPRVVFLGTSLTAGLGLPGPEEAWPERVAELADSAGLPIEAVNAGVSGDTSAGGLRRLEWILREPLDVLVVELGANDGLRGQDPDATAANLRQIVRSTRERWPGARVLLCAMEAPPNMGDAYTERFRAVFPAVARETGAELVPFLLDGVAGVPELNQDDGIHPTPEGHRRMAANVWPSLEPAVRAWWAERARP